MPGAELDDDKPAEQIRGDRCSSVAFVPVLDDEPGCRPAGCRSRASTSASRQHRLGRARALRGPGRAGRHLGRHLWPGDLPPSARRHRVAADQARHHRPLDLLGLRAGARLRLPRRGVVRHGGERLGRLHRQRRHLEELDPQGARSRVAVRGSLRHRHPGRHHRHRHRRRAAGDHRQRKQMDRDRRRGWPRRERPGGHGLPDSSQRVRPPSGGGTPRLDRNHAAGQSAAPAHAARDGRPSRWPRPRFRRPTRCSSAAS